MTVNLSVLEPLLDWLGLFDFVIYKSVPSPEPNLGIDYESSVDWFYLNELDWELKSSSITKRVTQKLDFYILLNSLLLLSFVVDLKTRYRGEDLGLVVNMSFST